MAAARADFFSSGEASGVPDTVAASWLRSRSAGVDASRYQVPYHSDIDVDSRLARCARPVLERLELDMHDVPVTIALTDSHARIIDRRDCSTAVGQVLDGVDFNPGYCFGEVGVGTNGIGTVFEAGAPISVVGAAHFNEALVPFACTGAPVVDPLSGRVEGVLDVSLLAQDWNPLIGSLVRAAAGQIGQNLLADRSRTQQALFEAYVRADARSRHAVLAIGDSVILNRAAQRLLSAEEQLILQQHARQLTPRQDLSSENLTLASGRTFTVRAHRVRVGQTLAGVVLVVAEVAPRRGAGEVAAPRLNLTVVGARAAGPLPSFSRSGVGRAVPVVEIPAVADSLSPAWRAAGIAIHAAFAEGTGIIATGERGCGRASLAERVFADRYPNAVVLDRPLTSGPESLAEADRPRLLVLRDLEDLDDVQLRQAELLVRACTTRPAWFVVATLASAEPRLDAILRHFEHSVAVPALRHRAVDLPVMTRDLLRELAPHRRVRLSAKAAQVVAAYGWPGNLAQLRQALAEALARRPAGDLLPEDLPGFCRTTTARRLTAMEVAERDAIIAALSACDGNRVHAAAELGISRSSLYRKLRQFGITEV